MDASTVDTEMTALQVFVCLVGAIFQIGFKSYSATKVVLQVNVMTWFREGPPREEDCKGREGGLYSIKGTPGETA